MEEPWKRRNCKTGPEFAAFHARFASLFGRSEPREQAAKCLHGLLAHGLERKNGWQLEEAVGDALPDAMERLLYHSRWDADAARDRLQNLIAEAFGDPQAIVVIDETGLVKKGSHSVNLQRLMALPSAPETGEVLPLAA